MERVKIHYDNLHTRAHNSWYVEVPAESLEKRRYVFTLLILCAQDLNIHMFLHYCFIKKM